MGGSKTLHDEFLCRHSKELWHRQAMSIMILAEDHPSNEVSKIMLREARQIVKKKRSTKPPWLA